MSDSIENNGSLKIQHFNLALWIAIEIQWLQVRRITTERDCVTLAVRHPTIQGCTVHGSLVQEMDN